MTVSSRKGDWICTFTGGCFYPMDPRRGEVFIEDIAHALSMLCRFGGHCRQFYSVAEHSVRVMRALSSRAPDAKDSPGLLLAALLHDASEAYLIDLPRPIKVHIPTYKPIEMKVEGVIYDCFGINSYERSHPAIKICDNVLLATEKRDLMPTQSAEWSQLPDPLRAKIRPWSPKKAEKQFLMEFERLQTARDLSSGS